jgi:EAL domain-containing protein (putative c-di-GMP-specific phosphodiesterase class I)
VLFATKARFIPDTALDACHREADLTGARLIRDALEQDRFVLHVQPIVNLHTGLTTQYEVLLRIAGDDCLVMPCQFVPAAERLGLIKLVDRRVIDRSFELSAEHPDLTFDINLSGATIDDEGLADYIVERLLFHGADPHRIVFELTETVAVSNIAKARDLAQRLIDFGCGFAIDDFGAGFSSFYYLKHIPAHYVKIDGGFLCAAHSRSDCRVIETINRTAHDLGKETIAEYVCDAERLRLVESLGVDYGQGFHFSKPFPAAELAGYSRQLLCPAAAPTPR